jgi:hypothetical protein
MLLTGSTIEVGAKMMMANRIGGSPEKKNVIMPEMVQLTFLPRFIFGARCTYIHTRVLKHHDNRGSRGRAPCTTFYHLADAVGA